MPPNLCLLLAGGKVIIFAKTNIAEFSRDSIGIFES
jgi:hypothetical protein